jgi:hypothetical protein
MKKQPKLYMCGSKSNLGYENNKFVQAMYGGWNIGTAVLVRACTSSSLAVEMRKSGLSEGGRIPF